MKRNHLKPVYIVLIIILALVIMLLPALVGLNPVAAGAAGAGLLTFGVTQWRVYSDPDYAKSQELLSQDERLAYIADKSRSITLTIMLYGLPLTGLVLLALDLKPYGLGCILITCGILLLYFIIYQIMSRRY